MTTTPTPARPQLDLAGQAHSAPGPLNMNGMYLMHHGLRRDMGRFLEAIGDLDLADRRLAAALADHFEYVMKLLHVHHTGEDTHLWPLMHRLSPGDGEVLDAMEAEHGLIDEAITASKAGFQRLRETPDEEARQALLVQLRELADRLGQHLAHEETECIPRMMSVIPPADWAALEKKFERSYRMREIPKLYAWCLDSVPDKDVDLAAQDVPAALVFLYKRWWKPSYDRRMRGIWGSPRGMS
jgi:hypothetical protein